MLPPPSHASSDPEQFEDSAYAGNMSYRIVEFQSTPNPNALKCVLDKPLPEPIRSFRKREEAGDDVLAVQLFAVSGITSLLFSGGWMTINKSPDAPWGRVRKQVQEVLERA